MKKTNKPKIAYPGIHFLMLFFILSHTSCLIIDPIDDVSNTNFKASESFCFDIAVKNQHRIVIDAINGAITVKGKAGMSSAKISGQRIVESESYADAEAHLHQVEVIISDSNDEIQVETKQPAVTYGRQYQVIYYISIPDYWDIEIESVNGLVRIDSLNADIHLEVVNGDVVLNEIFGNIATGITNGQLNAKVTVPHQGFCKIDMVNGQIQLGIPKTTSAEFLAKVTNGIVGVSNLVLNNMVSSRNLVSGVLGNGQGTIKVETVNGTISVIGF